MLLFHHLSRWLANFALIITWLSLVAANPPAHSLEKTAMYFVYRNAVEAYGENQKKIAPGLASITGSHPDKGANYKEFINFISKKTYTDAEFTNAGVDLNDPDVEKATKFLLANGGSGQVNAQLIRPMAGAKYWDIVAKTKKVMLKSHDKLVKDGKSTTTFDSNKDKALTAIDEVAVVRGSDTLSSQPGAAVTKGLIADIGNMVSGAVLRLDQTTWKWDSSRTIYSPDLAKSLTDSTAGVFADTNAVKKAIRAYGKIKNGAGYDPAYTHYKVHKSWRHFGKKVRKRC